MDLPIDYVTCDITTDQMLKMRIQQSLIKPDTEEILKKYNVQMFWKI